MVGYIYSRANNNLKQFLLNQIVGIHLRSLILYSAIRYKPGTDLLSAQVFGVQKLDIVLAESPVEITFTLQHANLTKENVECVFWNHSLKYVTLM